MHGGDKPRRGFNEVWRSDQHWSRTNTTLKQPETSCSTKSFQYTSRSYSSILLLDFNHSWLKIIPLNEVYIRCIHSAPMCPLRGYLDYLPLIKLQFCIILIQTQMLGQILLTASTTRRFKMVSSRYRTRYFRPFSAISANQCA